ncbi:MAG: asparagine synthase (glutamine-hydrolyzing) [Nitrospirota bacterium]
MCGIFVSFGRDAIGEGHPCLTSISHRGPDGRGARTFRVNDGFLSMGHRRLSIIDLSDNARQPMRYLDGGLWITYNGEIYNYLELKGELLAQGYEFRTSSDTEVLLAAYRRWGKDCLGRLNGMFAFAIWDEASKTLFAARDRYGVKPLYYWSSPRGFALASEIKQLAALPGFRAMVNHDSAYQFLRYGDFCYGAETLWKDVFELEPGMMVEVKIDKWNPSACIVPETWYGPESRHDPAARVPEQEAAERFRFLLEDSIRLRLRADVPVGFALSGGLDSSTITCLGAESLNHGPRPKTFSACYEEPEYNESNFVRAVVDSTGAEPTEVFTRPSYIIENLDCVTRIHDLPTAGRAIFPHYNLCRSARTAGAKVLLEGQGPDEILAGYRSFFWAFLSELIMSLRGSAALSEYLHFRKINGGSLRADGKHLLKVIFPALTLARRMWPGSAGDGESLLDLRVFKQCGVDDTPRVVRDQKSVMGLHRVRMTLLRAILHNVDRSSMASSVEVRNPFLDYRLVEFCLSLPVSMKIRGGLQKYLLRKAMADVLPEKVRARSQKTGFSSPEAVWAKGALRGFYRQSLSELDGMPFVRRRGATQRFDRFLEGRIPYDRIFWRLINFHRWAKVFNISM